MAGHVLATAPAPTFALAGHSMGGRVALEVMRLALLALAHTEGMRTMGRQWLRGMVHPDVLPTITCPTLVLCGREDHWSPPEQHAQIAHGIAGATLQVIEHCGHMPTVEQPAELNRALAEWLQG